MIDKTVHIVFPNQLFKTSKPLELCHTIYLVEEYLFFKQYGFHKQKILFHRASMKAYEAYLISKNKTVIYIDSINKLSDIRHLLLDLKDRGCKTIYINDPTDNWLKKRTTNASKGIVLEWYDNPLFINTKVELESFFKPKNKKYFQTSFYKQQRQHRNILMSGHHPEGAKWTFDIENRKKYPKNKIPPFITYPEETSYYIEAKEYVVNFFNKNYGRLNNLIIYPTTHKQAEAWLEQFFEFRFHDFGTYEDAIVNDEYILNHSLISPLLNVGLLSPNDVIFQAIDYSKKNNVPINATEGFVRQILGWREFIRGVYEVKGSEERTRNFWGFHRKIPKSFYTGTTGIQPVDDVIKKVLKTGYAHHIERLMILGNFMMLCEFDPNDVYKWFMELFIDAYDWVMVPNVYGMSQFADGGIMSTKPYISSSNYIMKMSNYTKGNWQSIWDGLFWTFMDKHRVFFLSNPRLGMLIGTFDKMSNQTKKTHYKNAELFLETV